MLISMAVLWIVDISAELQQTEKEILDLFSGGDEVRDAT